MKNSLIFLMLFISTISYGQRHESGSIHYGTNNKLGFELNVVGKKNISYGFGLTFDLTKKNIGGEIPKDIYDLTPYLYNIKSVNLYDVGSLYGTFGYHFNKKIVVGAKLGFGSKKFYTYFYDNSYGNYITTDGGTYLLYGMFITRISTKLISPYLGYDNYNGINLGITYTIH